VQVDKAQRDADRAHALFASGSVAQAEVDNADAALRGAIAQRDAQKKVLEELENGARREEIAQAAARAREAVANEKLVVAGARVEDIRAARAAVTAAEGRLKQVLVMIDELTIRAPRPARVEALDLRPGDILAPSATAATLLEEGQLYVRIYVPETQLGYIRVGQVLPITVDSFAGRTFRGVVEHVNAVGEYSPRNLQTADERADQVFATRVGLPDGGGDLRAGMAAFAKVPK
jgi:multidrug resistance efflux pump